ncbi:translocation/assembly module TamB domain-containing protein [bacterium]|nr:MAG: translocation/assembly module TamB domain-containing protein [bacterium]
MIKWLRRIILSLLTSLIITMLMVQNSTIINRMALTKLVEFLEQEWHATITIESSSFNFFTSAIMLHHGSVTSTNHQGCSWQFEKANVYISPLTLLRDKKIHLYLTFYTVSGTSGFTDKTPDILTHLYNIFATKPTNIKVSPRSISLHNINIDTTFEKIPLQATINGTFALEKKKLPNKKNRWEGQLTVQSGNVNVHGKQLITNMTGVTTLNKGTHDTQWTMKAKHQLFMPFDQQPYDVRSTLSADQQWVSIHHEPQKLDLSVKRAQEKFVITGNIPLECAQQCINFFTTNTQPDVHTTINGMSNLDLLLDNNGHTIGTITTKKIRYKDYVIEECTCSNILFNQHNLSANLSIRMSPTIEFDGNLGWNLDKKIGTLSIFNKKQLSLAPSTGKVETGWVTKPQQCTVTATITTPWLCTGKYNWTLYNKLIGNTLPLKGIWKMNDQELTINGSLKKDSYVIQAHANPNPHISTILYQQKNTLPVVNMKTKPDSMLLEGSIHYPFVQSLLNQHYKRLVLGSKNFLHLTINQENLKEITGAIGFEQGKLYIPESRNLIEKIASNFTLYPQNKKMVLTDNVIGFCKGSVSCPQATLTFNDSYHLNFLHAPIQIDNLFVNWKKDFYGFIDSNLLLLKFPGSPAHASGNVIVKKSLLKNNIFSEETNTRFFLPSSPLAQNNNTLDLDLRINNEIPIKIVTPSLETTAHLDLHVQYQQQNVAHLPRVNGSITLDNGFIKFLRNKLFIEYGKIQFVTAHANDPLIDLVAKNRINKYMVNLNVTGSLQKPNIVLESSPALSEEQILGLLLAGSENATLQADLPAMIMQNLHNIVLGSKAVLPKTTSFFEKVTRPFKYVQISPNFTDQTGRGGIRGTISIDLNKQIHAQLEKNFNLQDDFAFQVEYFLSDDVNLKAVKDQRGDIGSEVEVRFKF